MRGRICDISGQKFGKLLALKFVRLNRHKKAAWLCRCDCGNRVEVLTNALKTGNTNSCGCIKKNQTAEFNRNTKTKNLVGKKFGLWLVIDRDSSPHARPFWWCKCSCGCGQKKSIEGGSLTRGLSTSCGVIQKYRVAVRWGDEIARGYHKMRTQIAARDRKIDESIATLDLTQQ